MAIGSDVANLVVALRLDDSGFSGKLNRAAGQLRAMDGGLSQMGRGAGQVTGGLVRLGTVAAATAAGGLAAVVHTAASYEEAFIGVEKTVDATDAQFLELEDTLKRMAGTTGTAFEELAAIGEAGGALGIGVDDLEAFIDVVNRLGVSTNLSTDQAATALGQLSNILDLNGDELRGLADSLVALGNAGASTEDQIVDMAARFAAAGNSAGLSTEEILALSSSVASMGIEVEAGGSSLSRLFNQTTTNIGLANSKSKEFAESLGLTFDEFKEAWDTDALGTFEDLLGHLNTLDQFEGAALLKGIGITNTRDINAIMLMAQNVDFLGEQLTVAEEAQGALNTESDKFFGSTSANWQKVVQNVRNAADTIGTELLPVANELMTEFVDWLNEPGTQRGLTDFANDLADGVRGLVSELKGADFSSLLGGLQIAADVAKGAFDLFNKLPEPVKQLAIAALVANKVTGGAIGQIAGGLANIFGGALKTIYAGHVTVIGGTGGGGVPGAGGRGGGRGGPGIGSILGLLSLPAIFGAGQALAGGKPWWEQTPPKTVVRDPDRQQAVKDANANRTLSQLVTDFNMSEGRRFGQLESVTAELRTLPDTSMMAPAVGALTQNLPDLTQKVGAQSSLLAGVKSNTGVHTGILGGILRKPSTTNVNVATTVVVSGSHVNQTLSSLRQTIGGGGFI